MNHKRYTAVPAIALKNRRWPDNRITKAPIWCSVDLRDGNQALVDPMEVEEKTEFFNLLVEMGFKQIEAGFPAASDIEFEFIRSLAKGYLIPDDVTIQVLSQCRPALLEKTFEAIKGIKKVIFHIYNNTSPLQREVVYRISKEETIRLAVDAAKRIKEFAKDFEGEITLEYSPESFIETEPEFALEVCNAVIRAWEPTPEKKMIIDLPSTVEYNTPNVFADRIEWLSDRLECRESLILSIHLHNDRGTAVAAAELSMLAGVERIEGTLFGNGERTGNVDLITLACNMFSEGIDPELDLEDIPHIRAVYEKLVKLHVPERYPYAGDLVFTAFSGGHQDAINKGIKALEANGSTVWKVPYLPIDPADIGRIYEPIVRINSQSGKGGVAFILDNYYGFKLPKGMHSEFSAIIKHVTREKGELTPDLVMAEFKTNYIDKKEPYHFRQLQAHDVPGSIADTFHTVVQVTYTDNGELKTFNATGNGPIDAVKTGLQKELSRKLKILDYSEHALQEGSNAQAAAYIHLEDLESGRETYGVGISSSTTRASIRAIFSALNRLEV